ncbi:MAG: MarR family winged helix-turn-helix transcriptional regulator [Acidimicrobiales bacterium]
MTDTTDDTPWLAPEQHRAWISTLALTQALPSALDAQLKRDAGMNCFEYLVLARLSEAPGRTMRMSALAVLAQGSLSRLSHAVTRLEKSGWVTRRPSPEDGRHTEAQLTPAGWKKVQRVAPGHVREVRRLVVDVLTPTQLTQLGRAARAVVEAAAPGWLDSELVVVSSN